MLEAVVLEFNKEYGANQVVGKKNMSHLTVKEAHERANEFVQSLQEYKENKISYNLIQNGSILAYI
ncbi:hypothetical protein Q7A53_05655 [Halobacillus rhizosphaerae]|uniref:hypothetical protein n=1 Tax=Halobacillus rhizosphaerae TaxID=3064889 RepID=UPI00398B104D